MPIIATGQISIVDLSDGKSLSCYITSNLPKTQILNPNPGGTISPDWSGTPKLTLTPVVFANQTSLALGAAGLSITWKRKEGAGSEATLATGEAVSGGILTVSANKLTGVTSGLLTYLCYVTYTDPETNIPVNVVADITFSQIQTALNAKTAWVSGEQIFKYDTSNTVTPAQITLTANVANVTITKWQYKNSSDVWTDYPTTADNASITGSTLNVKPSHAVFVGDGATLFERIAEFFEAFFEKLQEIIFTMAGSQNKHEVFAFAGDMEALGEMRALFEAGMRGAEMSAAEARAESGEMIRHSLNPNFRRQIKQWDGVNPRVRFVVGRTSDILQSIGVREQVIELDSVKLIKIRHDHPEMTDRMLEQVPQVLEHPVIVMQNFRGNLRVTVFGELYGIEYKDIDVNKGKIQNKNVPPVLVALELLPTGNGGIKLNVIKMANAFAKDGDAQAELDHNRILYVDPDTKRTESWLKRTGLHLPVGINRFGSIGRVSYVDNAVKKQMERKTDDDKDKIRTSLKDSDGNALTAQQAEYFKDSVVRDGDGNLLVVYHGTNTDFTVFSHAYINRHGSGEGRGFYFTDSKSMATGYSRNGEKVLAGYLNITKPLSDSKRTLTLAQVKKLLRAIDPTGDDVISSYATETRDYGTPAWYTRSLNEAATNFIRYNDTDSDLLADITHSGGGDEGVLTAVRNVLGYDGYIVKGKYEGANVYVAFTSNQFKNVDNDAPTADPDIRFSLMDTARVDAARMEDEQARYEREIGMIQRGLEMTEGHRLSAKAIDRLAAKLLKQKMSDYDKDTLAGNLTALFDYIANEEAPDWAEIMRAGTEIAKGVLEKSRVLDKELWEAYANLRSYFRETGIRLTSVQKTEVAHSFDSYGAFRRRNFGRFRLTDAAIALKVDRTVTDNLGNRPDTAEATPPHRRRTFSNATRVPCGWQWAHRS